MTNAIQPFHLIIIDVAGWLNRHQQVVIDSLIEENRVLKEQLEGHRLRFTDEQRIRLAVKANVPGRPRVGQEITDLVLRMARENVSSGCDRIQGALDNLGYIIAPNTVKNILKRHRYAEGCRESIAGATCHGQFNQ